MHFLDEKSQSNAVQSCKLFRDAEFEDVDLNRGENVSKREEMAPPESPRTPSTREKFLVVPPGKLGIRLENQPSKRGTIVTLVGEDSPLKDEILKGDLIVNVNGVNVERMDTHGEVLFITTLLVCHL
jgi:hypothetical protein